MKVVRGKAVGADPLITTPGGTTIVSWPDFQGGYDTPTQLTTRWQKPESDHWAGAWAVSQAGYDPRTSTIVATGRNQAMFFWQAPSGGGFVSLYSRIMHPNGTLARTDLVNFRVPPAYRLLAAHGHDANAVVEATTGVPIILIGHRNNWDKLPAFPCAEDEGVKVIGVSVDADDLVTVLALDNSDPGDAALVSYSARVGGSWTTATVVAPLAGHTYSASTPTSVTTNSRGDLAVGYVDRGTDGSTEQVVAVRAADDTDWDTHVLTNDSPCPANHTCNDVEFSPSGELAAAWTQSSEGLKSDLVFAYRDAHGTWTSPAVLVADVAQPEMTGDQVSVASDGVALIRSDWSTFFSCRPDGDCVQDATLVPPPRATSQVMTARPGGAATVVWSIGCATSACYPRYLASQSYEPAH